MSRLTICFIVILHLFAEVPVAMAQAEWKSESNIMKAGKHGAWTARSGINSRPLLAGEKPEDFSWGVSVELQQGRAAGFLFSADESGENGYAVYLSNRHNTLSLSRVGQWPEEEKLDEFPWQLTDGNTVRLTIVHAQNSILVKLAPNPETDNGPLEFPILEAHNVAPIGNYAGLYMIDAEAEFLVGELQSLKEFIKPVLETPLVGEYKHVYDPGEGEEKTWYINDHCFVQGKDNTWHLYGITREHPPRPLEEIHLAHATAENLYQEQWEKKTFALTAQQSDGERHLWAPHVIENDDKYYMFYCAGSLESNWQYRIHLATSTDLEKWTRHENNPLFMDYFDARDPMVLKIGEKYVMYYTAILDSRESNHVVACRTSIDLLEWSPARVCFVHPARGTVGGPTESPFVVQRDGAFYLFIGPADGEYHRTAVYRSSTPYYWRPEDFVTNLPSHAAEVIHDQEGNWHVSDCGWDLRGVRLAPMKWEKQDWSFLD